MTIFTEKQQVHVTCAELQYSLTLAVSLVVFYTYTLSMRNFLLICKHHLNGLPLIIAAFSEEKM